MKSLLGKGYIDKKDKKYFLTQSGLEATQGYLINTLARQGALAGRQSV
jgi:predicted transcriptional regulator